MGTNPAHKQGQIQGMGPSCSPGRIPPSGLKRIFPAEGAALPGAAVTEIPRKSCADPRPGLATLGSIPPFLRFPGYPLEQQGIAGSSMEKSPPNPPHGLPRDILGMAKRLEFWKTRLDGGMGHPCASGDSDKDTAPIHRSPPSPGGFGEAAGSRRNSWKLPAASPEAQGSSGGSVSWDGRDEGSGTVRGGR